MLRCFAFLLLFTSACDSPALAPEAPAEPAKITVGEETPPETTPEDVALNDTLEGEAYVTNVTAMRKLPSTDYRVEDPDTPGKKMSNWIATLHAGETVTVESKENDEWVVARASDDSEGFLQKRVLLSTRDARHATVLDEIKVFSRPDLLALNTARTIAPGTLVFVLQEKDQFSEIRSGYRNEWVLTEKLVTEAREIEAAKLLAKARWLKEKKDDAYGPLMELLESQFADTELAKLQRAAVAKTKNDDAEEAGASEASSDGESGEADGGE